MATPLEEYLKMSTQERQGVDRVQREMSTPYQALQKPQFVQDVRDALPAGSGFYDPAQVDRAMGLASPSYTAGFDPERQRADDQIRAAQIAAMRDPSFAGSPEAQRAGLGLATSRFPTFPMAGPDGRGVDPSTGGPLPTRGADPDPDADDNDLPSGVVTPRGPSIYDMERGLLERTLGSQLEGFGEQRDLVAQLTDMREQGIAGQQQFAEDRATGREEFLEESDIRRAEQEEAARVERTNRKTAELARQQTQLDGALAAVGVDKNLAGQRLQSLGIDPGGFADADMSETTAMLYSQNMSAANMVNQLDGVAEQAAMFAKSQNDQASAAAMFGIGEDLAYAIQAFDQARLQGQIDDAQALQGIADAERQARMGFDQALTTLDVETKRAAQAAAAAAAARARKEAKEQEMLAAGVVATQAIQKVRAGQPLTTEEYMAAQMSGMSDDLLGASANYVDAVAAAELREDDISLEAARAARDELYNVQGDVRKGYGTLDAAGNFIPTPQAADQSNKIPIPLATGQVGYFSPGDAIAISEYNQTYGTGINPEELLQFFRVAQLPEEQR